MRYETGHLHWPVLMESSTLVILAGTWLSSTGGMLNAADPHIHFHSVLAVAPSLAGAIAGLALSSWSLWTRYASRWITQLGRLGAWCSFIFGLYSFMNDQDSVVTACLFIYACAMMLMLYPNSLGKLHGRFPLPQLMSGITLSCPVATLCAQTFCSDGTFLMPTAEACLLSIVGINILCLQAGELRVFLRAKQGTFQL